jgi:hypothetical protein
LKEIGKKEIHDRIRQFKELVSFDIELT